MTPLPESPEVDAYLDALKPEQKKTLTQLRATLRSILPDADEGLSYGMPAFIVEGKAVASYAAFKNHCGYYPMSGSVIEHAGSLLDDYETSKGGFKFATGSRLPKALVRSLVDLRLDELGDAKKKRR